MLEQPTRAARGAVRRVCAGALGVLLASLAAAEAPADVQYRIDIPGVTPGRVPASGVEYAVAHTATGGTVLAEARVGRLLDRASPALAKALCQGTLLPLVRIEARATGTNGVSYYAIRLHDVLVSSYAAAGGLGGDLTDDRPTESVSFNYGKVEWTYIATDAAGVAVTAAATGWDGASGIGGVTDDDSDGDGLPDSYERDQRLKPLVNDADGDADGDGLSNLDEYRAGTAANDSNSVFRVTGVAAAVAPGVLLARVTFNSVPGRVYDLFAGSTVEALAGVTVPLQTVTATQSTTEVVLNLPAVQAFVRANVRVP